MAKYETGDIVTFWFVIYHDPRHGKRIQAFSDNKNLVKFYMEFHKCEQFSLKSLTGTIDSMIGIMNDNTLDELEIASVYTRDPNAKKGRNKMKLIQVPMTQNEMAFVKEDSVDFLSSQINYSYLAEVIPYLKEKYQRALDDILLTDIIQSVVHQKRSRKLELVDIDQISLMPKLPNSHFGL